MVNHLGGVRQTTHDPATGVAFPCHASYVRPAKGKRNTPRYRLKVPDALCDDWGIKSRCVVYRTLQALLDSDLYKRVVDGETRLNHLGTKRVKRTAACRNATVREYEQLVRDGVQIPPQLHFRHPQAVWAVTRTFGTGWTFRATALTYKDATRLYDECVNVRSVAEVIGNAQPTPRGAKAPFSRKVLSRLHAEPPRADDEEEGEEIEVEAVEVVDEEDEGDDEGDDEDEEEEEEEVEAVEEDVDVVEEVTFRSSRSGRACKRPNLYIREPARPQQQTKRSKPVVGKPVMAVAVEKVAATSGASADAPPIPTYDDAEEMRSLKEIRKRIAHLL